MPTALRGHVLLVCATVLLATRMAPRASACDYTTMRDAAFNERRDVHRLCVVARQDDAAARAIHDRLSAWRSTAASDLNVEITRIDADDPQARWGDLGIPSAPPEVPATVLAGWRTFEKQGFLIDHWEPGPVEADLAVILDSPARQAIAREVGRRVAVFLYIRGTDAGAGAARAVIDATVKAWTDKWPVGFSVVEVDRSNPRERLIRSFTGVPDSGPDWLAVVFGRGKLLPPLVGPEIAEQQLNEQLELVVQECTCTRSPSTLGVDLPMIWTSAMDAAFIPLKSEADAGQPTTRPATALPGAAAVGGVVVRRSLLAMVALAVVVAASIIVLALRRRQA